MAKQPTLRTIKTGEVFTVVNEHGIETDGFWGPDGHLYVAKGGLGSGRTTYTRKSKNLPFKLKKKSNPKRQSSSLNPPYYIYYADSYRSKKPTITEAKRYVRQAVSNVHPIEGFSIRDGDDKLIIDYETGKERKHNPMRKSSTTTIYVILGWNDNGEWEEAGSIQATKATALTKWFKTHDREYPKYKAVEIAQWRKDSKRGNPSTIYRLYANSGLIDTVVGSLAKAKARAKVLYLRGDSQGDDITIKDKSSRYVATFYVDRMKKSNPSSLIGKWIPAQAVKVNANGTVNIKRAKR